jgi:hypothetical protein
MNTKVHIEAEDNIDFGWIVTKLMVDDEEKEIVKSKTHFIMLVDFVDYILSYFKRHNIAIEQCKLTTIVKHDDDAGYLKILLQDKSVRDTMSVKFGF